jgi:hypothetical protein
LAELRRDMERRRLVSEQIRQIENARLERIKLAPSHGPHAMVRLLARVIGIGIETVRQTVEDSVPTLNGFPPLPFTPGGGQSPDHVPPAHAAALGGVEPVHMSDDQRRELLVSSARKVEVLSHRLQAGFKLFVLDHPSLPHRRQR